jgi:beta-barrel assembly-enhancing protease
MNHLRLAILSVVLSAAAAFAQGPTQLHPGFNLFTKEQDVQLGQETAAQIRKHVHIVEDPFLNAYVNQIGQRLASAPEAQESGFKFTFEVVADPSINAYALPGGPMFINTGLLKTVDNEAELAGAMGHEMSHVILRHGTNQATKAELVELPVALATSGNNGGTLASLAKLGIGLGANSVLLKFSRTAESQADLMGSHLMAEAGYNPMQLARFFEELEAKTGRGGIQFLSDHPNPENREHAIEDEADRLPRRNYGYQTGQFDHMKQVVASIPEPPPPKPQAQQ